MTVLTQLVCIYHLTFCLLCVLSLWCGCPGRHNFGCAHSHWGDDGFGSSFLPYRDVKRHCQLTIVSENAGPQTALDNNTVKSGLLEDLVPVVSV